MYPDNYMNPMNNPMTNPNYGYNRMQQVQQMQRAINPQVPNMFGQVEQPQQMQSFISAQQCCCETNRNIDAVRAENYKNTCEITTAIHAEAEATRALMTANVMQELRDQLQAAQLQLGNLSQTQNIINAVRPFPQPAYITCSPYTSANGFGCNNGCGCI